MEIYIALIGLIFTISTAFFSAQRASYQRVEEIIRDVTLGEIAQARHDVANFAIKSPKIDHATTMTASEISSIENIENYSSEKSIDAFLSLYGH